ncbi:MAG: hypothetical protein ACXVEF_08085 [Polyangiales bacterium]
MRFAQILLGALFAFFGATLLLEGSASAATKSSGAPLCDDRAASVYAEEPAPQPVDSGDVTQAPDGCKGSLVEADPTNAPSHDDLQRAPELSADPATLVGAPPAVPAIVLDGIAHPALDSSGPADEHRLNDNPPPRPIPWRG